MKTIKEIYNQYKIMPGLQLHQLRVAAVAAIICNNLAGVDESVVVKACLFHDMGNILKSDLNIFPEFLQPEGQEYWQKVKEEYLIKYGPDEHAATKAIALELGLPKSVTECIDNIGFTKGALAINNNSMEQKICCYADQRVGPFGILSIQDRVAEGKKRYAKRKDRHVAAEVFENLAESLVVLEKQIFAQARIKPTDINDVTLAPIIEIFKELKI